MSMERGRLLQALRTMHVLSTLSRAGVAGNLHTISGAAEGTSLQAHGASYAPVFHGVKEKAVASPCGGLLSRSFPGTRQRGKGKHRESRRHAGFRPARQLS